ncbi:MAG: 50S ribosomal protein L4 [Oscillospiraceae bacterium]
MPTVKVYNMAGEVTGEVELSEAIFGIEPNEQAIHATVKSHLANLRQGTQSALTRAEVSGGGIKPFRQKGTGRARQGSIRAPHYTHGGVAFAPKPRDYSISINKKVRRLAIRSALSQKVLDGAVIVVDGLELPEIKTKGFKNFLEAVKVDGKALVVTPEVNTNVVRSARNIPGMQTTVAAILSAYDIMNAKTFIVDKAALSKIEEVYA